MRLIAVLSLAAAAGSILTGCGSTYTVPADEVRRLGAQRAAEESDVAAQRPRRKVTRSPTVAASVGLRPGSEAFGQGRELSNPGSQTPDEEDAVRETRINEVMRICR